MDRLELSTDFQAVDVLLKSYHKNQIVRQFYRILPPRYRYETEFEK